MELLVLDSNTWNHITVVKLLIIGITLNYLELFNGEQMNCIELITSV